MNRWRIVPAILAGLPILGLGLFALVPFRPAVTLYALVTCGGFAADRWWTLRRTETWLRRPGAVLTERKG